MRITKKCKDLAVCQSEEEQFVSAKIQSWSTAEYSICADVTTDRPTSKPCTLLTLMLNVPIYMYMYLKLCVLLDRNLSAQDITRRSQSATTAVKMTYATNICREQDQKARLQKPQQPPRKVHHREVHRHSVHP